MLPSSKTSRTWTNPNFRLPTLDRLFLNPEYLTPTANEITLLEAMKTAVTAPINLSDNQLGKMNAYEIAEAFKAIPATATTLDLSYNELVSLGATGLMKVLGAIPATITTLDLSLNMLECIGTEGLANAFAAIPKTVTTLILRSNNLGRLSLTPYGLKEAAQGARSPYNTNELVTIVKAIPKTIKELDLSFNGFGAAQLTKCLSFGNSTFFPIGCRLSRHPRPSVELAAIFKEVPTAMVTLNLSYNSLYRSGADGLTQAFKAMPATVTTLNLSVNELSNLDGAAICQILDGLPDTLQVVNLSGNGISTHREKEQIMKSLIRSGKVIEIEEPLARELNRAITKATEMVAYGNPSWCTEFQSSSKKNNPLKLVCEYAAPACPTRDGRRMLG